jgi:hypothetical protein
MHEATQLGQEEDVPAPKHRTQILRARVRTVDEDADTDTVNHREAVRVGIGMDRRDDASWPFQGQSLILSQTCAR